MDFSAAFARGDRFLMEGALGERLKREYNLTPYPHVALAGFLTTPAGRKTLGALWLEYAQIAHRHGFPFLATTPTRRANRSRVTQEGLGEGLLRESVCFLRRVLEETEGPAWLGGMVGCRGDAYTGEGALSQEEAVSFHSWQTNLLAEGGADFLYGALLPTLPEATGLAQAMARTGLPYILSFTIEKTGCLIDGTPIAAAIEWIDGKSFPAPLCYMSNCVHPSIVRQALSQPCNQRPWVKKRFLGIQGNTSPLSYDQLDRATDLLTSDPVSFAREEVGLLGTGPFQIFGGCCGTDGRHMEQIARLLAQR